MIATSPETFESVNNVPNASPVSQSDAINFPISVSPDEARSPGPKFSGEFAERGIETAEITATEKAEMKGLIPRIAASSLRMRRPSSSRMNRFNQYGPYPAFLPQRNGGSQGQVPRAAQS
jgi:hypothetical protein